LRSLDLKASDLGTPARFSGTKLEGRGDGLGANRADEASLVVQLGKSHDQADAEWIIIRWPLRGRNDTPCLRPTPGRPIGRHGMSHPWSVFDIFSTYQLVILLLNNVRLILFT
jgi:hypothetical protein